MKYRLSHPGRRLNGTIELTASKSESNRALLIQALCAEEFEITNLAAAEDTLLLQKALQVLSDGQGGEHEFNVGMAGTTLRFLTAYLATRPGTYTLTGSERMLKRPVGILVDALQQLGADITYLGEEGFPPLRIEGKPLRGSAVTMKGNVSSQFISALLLISPRLQNGLVIHFDTEVTSRPYVNMTLKMMEEFRVYGMWQGDAISVSPQIYRKKSEPGYSYKVEGDWSSASYWYSMLSLAEEGTLTIRGLKHPSLQGDAVVADIFTFFGVHTEYTSDGIVLTKRPVKDEHFGFDFSDCPDLAQTAAVTVSGLGIPSLFNGLHTLRIKETDRIIALQNELAKINVKVTEHSGSLSLEPSSFSGEPEFSTYNDHRMAMAFAALAIKYPGVTIDAPEVVKKSYPGFWDDLRKLGFEIRETE